MGQYYKAVLLNLKNKPNAHVSSYDLGSGSKLMEHSWRANSFVRFVEKILINNPIKLVWSGDYADEEPTENENLYTLSDNSPKISEEVPEGQNRWDYKFKSIAPLRYKYMVNMDKKEFVNKDTMPKDNHGWRVHPLPLLTCEGNGRGGGDYRYNNGKEYIGSWARNKIMVVSRKSDIPKDFREIKPMFMPFLSFGMPNFQE